MTIQEMFRTALPCPHCGQKLAVHDDREGCWLAHDDEAGPCISAAIQILDGEDLERWNMRYYGDQPQEHGFDGGLNSGDERVDVALIEDRDHQLEMRIVTGASVFSVVDLSPTEIKNLGNWMRGVARDVIERRERDKNA